MKTNTKKLLKVQSTKETEHLLAYIEHRGGYIKLVDKSKDIYTALINDEKFTIHENVIQSIKLKNQHIGIVHKIMQ